VSIVAHAGGWDELAAFLVIPLIYGIVRGIAALRRRRHRHEPDET